ncbi:monovalent cation/H+ antiporter subunit D [Propionivibrio sp.]|uniref:monovalent cation/H+ antiporter subunit D n=1 Tax=Propionivibrio sp. TaxID=2212460 RepID=UPI003BF299C4
MNQHAPILLILIPFLAALLQLLQPRLPFQRAIGLLASLLGVAATVWLTLLADDGMLRVYALGGWSAPFGIVLVADRLAAGMTLLTTLLGLCCLLYASGGFDARGRFFHPLFQLQILGLNGAFLTGDLFNLFVFFEIMLLASYALLAQTGGLARTRAEIAYVVLNLLGSSIFLIGLGLLYGTLGTLNLADVAYRLSLPGILVPGVRLALVLLVSVFVLKAALLPLSFWLPHTYAAAPAPVAALFAIMTKVGIVALLRLQVIAIYPAQPDLLDGWLTTLALATVLFAVLGALAAKNMKMLAAWLVLLSAGTLLVVPAQASAEVSAAGLFYLVHSTFAGAAFFLLADVIAEQRGAAGNAFVPGQNRLPAWSGIAFLMVAMTLVGLPPFSGFIGKLMLLDALRGVEAGVVIWAVLLSASLLVMMALVRGGSTLIWENGPSACENIKNPPQSRKGAEKTQRKSHVFKGFLCEIFAPLRLCGGCSGISSQPPGNADSPKIGWRRLGAMLCLIAAGPLLALFVQPIAGYAQRTATQLHDANAYIHGVLGNDPASIQRESRE